MNLISRYDILVKFSCLIDYYENKRKWTSLSSDVYKSHLNIITSGTFREADKKKSGISTYFTDFEKLTPRLKKV